jgi:Tol biopolymer transport system component
MGFRSRIAVLVAALLAAVVLVPAASADAALPRNGKIAFVRANQIYVANADGTGVKRLTPDRKNYRPQFSRDGKKIAYVHEVGGAADLWIMNADGSGKRRVTTTGDVGGPAWSPDGQRLAYVGAGGLRTVRTTAPYTVQRLSGFLCGETELTPLSGTGNVAWSPNGRSIVYYTGQGCDSPDNYLNSLDPTTNVVTTIWAIGGECCGFGYFADPAFSSDSALLAYDFVYQGDPAPLGPPTIEVLNFPARTSAAFAGRDNDRFPAFAPNNRYVLFSTAASGTAQIWRAELDGANRKKITSGYQPTWQPRP